MNKGTLENALRGVCQNMGIVGARGPVPSWIFPAAVVMVIILTLILVMLVKVYEMLSTGTCMLCGKSHKNNVAYTYT
jgi:hypothetical protein